VRPIPAAWAGIKRLKICVSIDGLQPEHDVRRTPATYDRILKHIVGHQITVHCTVTRQQVQRDGYIEAFAQEWSGNPNVRTIWVSLYTPQIGEESAEQLRPEDRARVVHDLMSLRERFPKLQMPKGLLKAYLAPPTGPDDCIFAKTTECVSADLTTKITPCQFGGNPDCGNCGCMASAGLSAVANHHLPGGLGLAPSSTPRSGSATPCGLRERCPHRPGRSKSSPRIRPPQAIAIIAAAAMAEVAVPSLPCACCCSASRWPLRSFLASLAPALTGASASSAAFPPGIVALCDICGS
jgi:hypothetical protein